MCEIDISVAMATFNGEHYIREQIESILSQTLQPKEIVIVDDCSTDSTWEILMEYAEKSPILKAFRNEANMGAHQNFRKAFSLASCPYIAPSDQDDIWRNDKLEVMAGVMMDHKVSLVYSQEDVLWEDGRITYCKADMPDMLHLMWGNNIKGHTLLFKRDLMKVYEVAKLLSFDYSLVLWANLCNDWSSTGEALSVWRRHVGVLTTAFSDNSELVISPISSRRKTWIAIKNLRQEKSMPILISFTDRAKILSMVSPYENRQANILSKVCENVACQSYWSMVKASFFNMLAQHYEGGVKRRIAHALWAARQPWVYWYDMHKLHALE